MNEVERWNEALMIALDDLNEPNEATRRKAIDKACFVEFMEIRQGLIEYAHTNLYKSSSLIKDN